MGEKISKLVGVPEGAKTNHSTTLRPATHTLPSGQGVHRVKGHDYRSLDGPFSQGLCGLLHWVCPPVVLTPLGPFIWGRESADQVYVVQGPKLRIQEGTPVGREEAGN